MGEEKKGNVRLTLDVELSEAVMDMAREAIQQMPNMGQMGQWGRRGAQRMGQREQGQQQGQGSDSSYNR